MATDYDGLDEATLQRMANEAESYEERSAIRQAIRRKKKDRGENVGRAKARGNSIYNRFAGSTAPAKQAKPKNYVITEAEQTSPRPPSAGGRGSSRGSTTPTQSQKEISSSPVPRPRTPTPPPTPEQTQQVEEGASQGEDGGEPEGEEEDVAPTKEKEVPLSPPPSPRSPAEEAPDPPQQEEEEEPDGDERTPVAELPEEEKQDGDEEEEGEPEREDERAPSQEKEEPLPPEEQPVSPKQDRPLRRGREDTDSGGARFGGVTLKSRGTGKTTTPKASSEPQNEFLNLKLRQTSRDGSTGHSRRTESEPKVDFGVKLKSTPREKPTVSPPTHKRAGDSQAAPSSSEHSTPRTLRDYQELSSKSSGREKGKRDQGEEYESPSMEPDELQKYLVAYVNSELSLHPPLPVRGGALFETCSNPTNLCKLVNKSVPNTVDLRALSKISASASEAQRSEALRENMTLALESARAIGCRVNEDSSDNILGRNPQAIRDFLVDLIRAKAVNLPGMDDEPSSTFTNMVTLFEKLNISVPTEDESVDVGDSKEEVSWRDDPEKVRKALESPTPKVVENETWRDSPPAKPTPDTTEMSYEERAAMRRAQRERRARQAEESGGVELSYEERAAQRRAERERRRREREALAK